MTLEHNVLRPLVPTTLTVYWPDPNTQELSLELEGLEMNMGTIRYQLPRSEEGQFTIPILLPVCTQEEMTWIGRLSDDKNTVYPAIRMKQ